MSLWYATCAAELAFLAADARFGEDEETLEAPEAIVALDEVVAKGEEAEDALEAVGAFEAVSVRVAKPL